MYRRLADKFTSYEFFYQEYVVKKKSSIVIAKECNVSDSTIARWLAKHGIKCRGLNEFNFSRKANLLHRRFGMLTVIGESSEPYKPNEPRRVKWDCLCDCGRHRQVVSCQLMNNNVKNCGYSFHRTIAGYKEITNELFDKIERGAIIRNLKFSITVEEIWDLFIKQNRKCALSGVKLTFRQYQGDAKGTASLDRIDSNKDYTLDNVQWVHKDLNKMKLDMPESEFFKWIDIIYAYKHKLG